MGVEELTAHPLSIKRRRRNETTRTTGRHGLLMAIGALAPAVSGTVSAANDTIRIAHIEPMSGPFANVGDFTLKQFQLLAERMNANGGILGRDVEIVAYDNKQSAQESARILRERADEGIQYITQGNGFERRRGIDQQRRQAQPAQSGQPHPLSQLLRGRESYR